MELKDFLLYVVQFFGFFLTLFMGVPLLGARLIWKGLVRAKIESRTSQQCMQAYLYASSITFLLVVGANFLVRDHLSDTYIRVTLGAVYVGLQFVLVPLLLRLWSRAALLVEARGIALANLVGLGAVTLLYLLLQKGS